MARNENYHKSSVLNLKNMSHKLLVVRSYSYNALLFCCLYLFHNYLQTVQLLWDFFYDRSPCSLWYILSFCCVPGCQFLTVNLWHYPYIHGISYIYIVTSTVYCEFIALEQWYTWRNILIPRNVACLFILLFYFCMGRCQHHHLQV